MGELRRTASSIPDIEATGRPANGACVSDGGGSAAPDRGGWSLGRGPAA